MEREVIIRLTHDEAERLSMGVSDLLCWVRGFLAAYEGDNGPFGQSEVRRLSELLKRAIDRAAKEPADA